MRIATCVAALATLLFLAVPPAPAATTTMELNVSNQSGQGVIVEVRGNNYYGVKALSQGGQTSFSDQDTAYVTEAKPYTYQIWVYNASNHSERCAAGVLAHNIWDLGPQVLTCQVNASQGPCTLMPEKSSGSCTVKVTVGQ